MDIIVSYQYPDSMWDFEKEFACVHEAVAFADRCLECGGVADVTVYTDDLDAVPDVSYALCSVYFHWSK